MRTSAAAAALVCAAGAIVAATAAACDGPRSTPRAALDSVRAAISSRDPRLLHAIHDQDTLVHRRQVVRDWRALLARGDPPEQVLRGTTLTADDVTAGTPDDAVGRLFVKHSPLLRDGDWMLGAELVAEEMQGDDAAALRVRGADGRESVLWLVRERGRWVVDHARTWAPPPR